MSLAQILWHQGVSSPERIAVLHGSDVWTTYGQWAARSAALSQRLQEAGLQPGDRVLIFMNNHPRYLEILWGCWWAGLVVVPVNSKLHLNEADWIATDSGARWAFVNGASASLTSQTIERLVDIGQEDSEILFHSENGVSPLPLPQQREPEDLAWLFYTSGTTGRPKGVMLSHRNLMTVGMAYFVDIDKIDREDAIVYGAPISHGCGIYAIPHLMAGARHVVPKSGGVDPKEIFALGREIGPLTTFAAPTIIKRFVDYALSCDLTEQDAAQCFKTIVYGGAPMYLSDIQRALKVMGPRFVQIYGQGETPMSATVLARHHIADELHPYHADRLASVGVAQTSVQVRVADEQGSDLPTGQIGEVLVRGDTVMLGYWRNQEASAQALQDGWLKTGDLGYLNAEGFLTLKERSKDVVISGGSNIYPREVEEVLLTMPAVAEVSVLGAPDAEWGEVVVAFVVPAANQELNVADLDAHCLAHIARFKRPKRYFIRESLPKNNYGKIVKASLREELQEIWEPNNRTHSFSPG